MKQGYLRFGIIATALVATICRGQLIVDHAGARDVLFNTGEEKLTPSDGVRFNSKDKSLSYTYFGKNSLPQALGTQATVAFNGKIRGVDGWEELLKFEETPGMEAAGILNFTESPDKGGTWSVNFRLAYKHEEYKLFDAALADGARLKEESFDGASLIAGWGLAYANWGLSLAGGVRRESNYERLPEAEVQMAAPSITPQGDGVQKIVGKTAKARVGHLDTFVEYPFDFSVYKDLGSLDKVAHWLPFVPVQDGLKSISYALIVAPYVRYDVSPDSMDRDAAGIQFTVRRLKGEAIGNEEKSSGKQIAGHRLDYPLSYFIEREHLTTDGKDKTTMGVAIVYSF